MNDVRYPPHRVPHRVTVGDISSHDLEPFMRLGRAIVTKRANLRAAKFLAVYEAAYKLGTNFPCCASDEDLFHCVLYSDRNSVLLDNSLSSSKTCDEISGPVELSQVVPPRLHLDETAPSLRIGGHQFVNPKPHDAPFREREVLKLGSLQNLDRELSAI